MDRKDWIDLGDALDEALGALADAQEICYGKRVEAVAAEVSWAWGRLQRMMEVVSAELLALPENKEGVQGTPLDPWNSPPPAARSPR